MKNKIAGVATANIDEELRNHDGVSDVVASYSMKVYVFAVAGTGNITDDPLFMAAGSVFTLQDTSPAIDVGTNTGVTSADLVGNLRMVNGPNDTITTAVVEIGCYENQVAGAALLAPIGVSN